MNIIVEIVCIILFVFNSCAWGFTENKVNESCSISAAIYFVCFILLYILS